MGQIKQVIYHFSKPKTEIQKVSIANLIAFPQVPSVILKNDIFHSKDDIICEILLTEADYIIGGYVAQIIPSYQVIYIKEFAINPKLKSSKYGRFLINRVVEQGIELYGEEFCGVLAISVSHRKQTDRDVYKSKVLFNSGGKLIAEDNIRWIYIGNKLSSDCVEELFKRILDYGF